MDAVSEELGLNEPNQTDKGGQSAEQTQGAEQTDTTQSQTQEQPPAEKGAGEKPAEKDTEQAVPEEDKVGKDLGLEEKDFRSLYESEVARRKSESARAEGIIRALEERGIRVDYDPDSGEVAFVREGKMPDLDTRALRQILEEAGVDDAAKLTSRIVDAIGQQILVKGKAAAPRRSLPRQTIEEIENGVLTEDIAKYRPMFQAYKDQKIPDSLLAVAQSDREAYRALSELIASRIRLAVLKAQMTGAGKKNEEEAKKKRAASTPSLAAGASDQTEADEEAMEIVKAGPLF